MADTQFASKPVSKKKATPLSVPDEPKNYGTMIRISIDSAKVFRKACALEQMSAAKYFETYLLPVIQKRYLQSLDKETKQAKGQGDDA